MKTFGNQLIKVEPTDIKDGIVTIPQEIQIIRSFAIDNSDICQIVFEGQDIVIEPYAIIHTSIQKIKLNKNIKKIYNYSFSFNHELKEVGIYNSKLELSPDVFYGCTNLRKIKRGMSVTNLLCLGVFVYEIKKYIKTPKYHIYLIQRLATPQEVTFCVQDVTTNKIGTGPTEEIAIKYCQMQTISKEEYYKNINLDFTFNLLDLRYIMGYYNEEEVNWLLQEGMGYESNKTVFDYLTFLKKECENGQHKLKAQDIYLKLSQFILDRYAERQ